MSNTMTPIDANALAGVLGAGVGRVPRTAPPDAPVDDLEEFWHRKGLDQRENERYRFDPGMPTKIPESRRGMDGGIYRVGPAENPKIES